MTLISQLKNYWNKLLLKKYKLGDKIEFIHKVNNIPNRMTGTIIDIDDGKRLPICVMLDIPIKEALFTTSYVNITLKQIL